MGTVYLALHPIMGRKAAVKVLKPELARDESLVTRFFNEARAANAIRHPNIIDIIDVGLLPEDNVPYMLMEFLEGESLAARLERTRPLSVPVAVEVAYQTASALAAAHSKGIVHRDLKPDNLFLVPDEMIEGGERVKVLDFGIAKLRDDMRGSSMKTRTGAIMGTAAYMSPEQCQGLIERIDQRTDVYALGIILYEMLCGAPPFISEGFGDIIIMHVMREPEAPQIRNPLIPDSVAAAMLCALAKNPENRFQSMVEFQAALRSQVLGHGTPMHGVPSVGTTAILDEQPPRARSASQLEYDRTMATPPPVALRPGSVPPSSVPSYLDSGHGHKKASTTFRTATGEVADIRIGGSGKRKTAIAIGAIVGMAAVGLGITMLVTKPTDSPKDKTAATTAAPAPVPDPIPAFQPPTPPPLPPPPPSPPPAEVEKEEPRPHVVEEPRRHRKAVSGKGRKSSEKPSERPATAPEPDDSSESGGSKSTERW
jgi:serine/threonine protein kinase